MDGPISVADAKLHLRVDSRDEDDNIARLIRTAARQIETIYGVVSVQRETQFTFDRFSRELRLPLIPVKPGSIAVRYLDTAGEEQELEAFRAFERHDWTWIVPAVGTCWPAAAATPGAISVTATVGYIDQQLPQNAQQDSVPADVQQAARLLVEQLFLRTGAAMPPAVDDLIDHYRYRRL